MLKNEIIYIIINVKLFKKLKLKKAKYSHLGIIIIRIKITI